MEYGMPQGSVVGPWMFTNYILPVGDIVKCHNLSYHLYADDSQIFVSFDPKIPRGRSFLVQDPCLHIQHQAVDDDKQASVE